MLCDTKHDDVVFVDVGDVSDSVTLWYVVVSVGQWCDEW